MVVPPIPFLVSHEALKNISSTLDFSARTLTIDRDFVIDLLHSHSGHLFMPLRTISSQADLKHALIFHGGDELSAEAVEKMHIHFGHADVATLNRICRI